MFAIAFDLVVAETQKHHPRGVAEAYADIRSSLAGHGFDWIQGSLYVSRTEDLAKKILPSCARRSRRSRPWRGSRSA
ncbi:virulence factor [Methylobacterium sp. Gmos1]